MTRIVEVPVEDEDLLCLSLMPSLWALPGDRWATLHELVHPRAAAIVEELDDAQLVASLLEAVAP